MQSRCAGCAQADIIGMLGRKGSVERACTPELIHKREALVWFRKGGLSQSHSWTSKTPMFDVERVYAVREKKSKGFVILLNTNDHFS